ncbi:MULTISPECIES: OmpH family outer membrane protein [Acidovorax]|uniref:OmpH family outer membrane protein n=1 Tax=Acidovorax facilis TaxID=12917 RepID=A0ABV8DIA0_9BURK|nr:OmpH family outer membrane protein [Acidovorax sp. SD340]MBO1009609.1 OmpH family outer membrane protein [Acidovorax sp. SD340]MCO4243734.1 OmpH family outer membrane protein [Acidovorax facilis]
MTRLLAFVLAVLAVSAPAQTLRVAYVDSLRVMTESAPVKVAESKLRSEFSSREKEIENLTNGLRAATDELREDTPRLSEWDLADRKRQLMERERELQRQRRELNEEWTRRRNEALTEIVDRTNRVIQEIAKSERLDLVVFEDVVFASPRADITDKVIKALSFRDGN